MTTTTTDHQDVRRVKTRKIVHLMLPTQYYSVIPITDEIGSQMMRPSKTE